MTATAPATTDALGERVARIADEAGAQRVAAAWYDYDTRQAWDLHGDEWFHAASTIKVPILLGVFGAAHRGHLVLDSRVHVRNRFYSVADGKPFRVESGRDANSEVHRALGRTMKVNELAYHMIVTSSNLATNLLVDLVGIDQIRESVKKLGVTGVDLRRGVEDERAWEAGLNNRVTAKGLISVLRPIEEGTAFDVELSARMLEILHDQEFRSGIPAGVPDSARVANKTGEISTVAHDAAIVYLPDRKPYCITVLTQWEPGASGRSDTIARVSRAVYEHLTSGDGRDG
jgi:beta-lactamase class A